MAKCEWVKNTKVSSCSMMPSIAMLTVFTKA